MRWALARIDSLASTAIAAVTGFVASQTMAFINAYLQRLGGHLDEARLGREILLREQSVAAAGNEVMREQLAAVTQARIDTLETAYRAIEQAGVFWRPVAFLRHVDRDIAAATAQHFNPALPIDLPSLIFAAAGIVLGWVLWELTKAPALLLRRQRTTKP